jgi:hypothetical protein
MDLDGVSADLGGGPSGLRPWICDLPSRAILLYLAVGWTCAGLFAFVGLLRTLSLT